MQERIITYRIYNRCNKAPIFLHILFKGSWSSLWVKFEICRGQNHKCYDGPFNLRVFKVDSNQCWHSNPWHSFGGYARDPTGPVLLNFCCRTNAIEHYVSVIKVPSKSWCSTIFSRNPLNNWASSVVGPIHDSWDQFNERDGFCWNKQKIVTLLVAFTQLKKAANFVRICPRTNKSVWRCSSDVTRKQNFWRFRTKKILFDEKDFFKSSNFKNFYFSAVNWKSISAYFSPW